MPLASWFLALITGRRNLANWVIGVACNTIFVNMIIHDKTAKYVVGALL